MTAHALTITGWLLAAALSATLAVTVSDLAPPYRGDLALIEIGG